MINENEIKKTLKNINVEPSKDWVFKTHSKLTLELLQQQQKKSYFLFFGMKPKYFAITLLAALVLSSGAGLATVQAAQASNPGDFLFGFEKTLEDFDRNRISDTQAKVEFENEVLQERIKETENIKNSTDSIKLKVSLRELKEQYERLLKEKIACTNCTQELLLSLENTLAQLSDRSFEIKLKAQSNGEVELEIEAEDLENETKEVQFEIEDESLEIEHEEETESSKDLTESEKEALEQQQELEKKQLEEQQELEKKQLEEQQEAQKRLLEQQQEGSKDSDSDSSNDSNSSSSNSGSNSGSGSHSESEDNDD